jgi:hypothetical protein
MNAMASNATDPLFYEHGCPYKRTIKYINNLASTHGGTMPNNQDFEENSSYAAYLLGDNKQEEMLPPARQSRPSIDFKKWVERQRNKTNKQ